MDLYRLDENYKQFIRTLVDGYVIGKQRIEDGSNPYIILPGMEVCNVFFDYTDSKICNMSFHKGEDNTVNFCYVFDSVLLSGTNDYAAQERFVKIKRSDFIYKLSLLKWLDDSGYIILVDDNSSNIFETGQITERDRQRWSDNGQICYEETIKSKFIFETLARYHNCRIIPSAKLIDIVNNKFKTVEQRRFETQTRLTWISIIIAVCIGIASPFISNYLSMKSVNQMDMTEIIESPTLDQIDSNKSVVEHCVISETMRTDSLGKE